MTEPLTWAQKQAAVFQSLGYVPTAEQQKFHSSLARVRLVAGGERGGKSFSSAKEAVWLSLIRGPGTYWLVGPDYEQPRKEFDYMLADYKELGYRVTRLSMPTGKSSPWSMKVDEIGLVQTKTSDDIKKIASEALHGALMAEAAQQSLESFLKIRGRIAEHRGWLIMSGTFETSLGWYADYFNRWQGDNPERAEAFSLPTWSNTAVYPGGRKDPEIVALERMFPADLFMERYGAKPSKPSTLIFPEFDTTTHVFDWVRFDREMPVYLAIDPGYDPGYYHVSALQVHEVADEPEQVWQVDEIHVQRTTGPEVIQVAMEKVWWGNVVDGTMDIAGRAHQAQESQIEIWKRLAGLYIRSHKVPILDGIARHRTFLKDPETLEPRLLHNPVCKGTLKEYTLYRRPTDKEGRPEDEVPIDRDNHAMKALAYWLYDRYGAVRKRRKGASGERKGTL